MSRDYGKVRTLFWGDEKVQALSPTERYLALYVLLSPHSNAIGCFQLPEAYVRQDTGMAEEEVTANFERLQGVGIVKRPKGSYVWIPNYIRHNPPENPNVWRKCVKELQSLPRDLNCLSAIANDLVKASGDKRMKTLTDDERGVLGSFLAEIENRIDTVSKPLPNPSETVSKTQTTVTERLLKNETTVSKGSTPNQTEPIHSVEPKGSTAAGAAPKVDPWKEVYDFGRDLLGHSAGGIITNLRKTFDDKPRKVLAKLQDAAEQRDPAPWINAFLWKYGPPGLENIGSMDTS